VTAPAGPVPAPGPSRIREFVGALIVYLMLAYIFTASTWADPGNRWVGFCCDQEQTAWFLAWVPTALELGQNPLLTDRLNAPDGANLMWNASSPLLGVLATPFTRTGGPIFAYNVAVLAGIALSGLAAFAALRRYTAGPLGPLVGGALYALSPYVASHTALHLQLIHVWAPPLFLIILDELIVRRRRTPEVLGVALGVVGALQILTFEEFLATSAVAGALLAIVIAAVVRERAAITTSLQRMILAVLPGLAAFVLIAGLPLAVQFLGPQQVHGAVQDTGLFSMDLLNPILPTSYQLIAPDAVTDVSHKFSGLYHEATGYIGLPLLLVLAWIVATRRDDRRVVVAAIMAVAMLVFSLGPELHVAGESWGVPMPWLPIGSLPLLEHALPGRLTLFMWLAIAVMVAIGVDHAAGLPRRRQVGARLAAIAAALVFVIPAPANSSTTEVPAFFRSWDQQGIDRDAVILFAPWFTNGAGADPMLWAAVAEARPRMYEGYVYVPDARGRPRYGPPPGPLAKLMIDAQDHGIVPALDGEARSAAFNELRNAGVSVVIVGPMRHRAEMIELFTDLFGEPPIESGGVQLWRDVGRFLRP
jgi:hypothetical protein